jgi:hypothetical protein
VIYSAAYAMSVALGYRLVGTPIGAVTIGDAVNFVAMAVIIAGVFVVARYKAALEASQAAAGAWKEERDATVSHLERVERDNTDLRATKAALEQRPDLTHLYEQMEELTRAVSELGAVMRVIQGGGGS